VASSNLRSHRIVLSTISDPGVRKRASGVEEHESIENQSGRLLGTAFVVMIIMEPGRAPTI